MKWPMVKLETLARKVSSWNPSASVEDIDFLYIDLSSVDKDQKKINARDVKNISAAVAPSRARQLVKENDVLISTVRPNLNGVALVTADFDGATASTGYCVLRADKNKLDERYLFYWVQSVHFIRDMISKATGANYPAVSDKIIFDSKIPLPPLDEQKHIAAILDKADAIRQKRQQAISLADDFLRSIFLEMFISAADDWTVKTIEYIADKGKGGLRTGPFGSHLLHSEFVDSGIPVLGIDNAVENSFKWGKARFITEEKYKSLSRYTVHPGDVLITIMGTCGRCAVVPDDIPTAINTKHLCCISLDYKKALPEFLHSYYLFHPMSRQYLTKVTKGAIMDGLNMGLIKTMPFPMVPIKLQEKYVEIKMAVLSNLDKQHLSESYQESLFNLLNQQLFAGKCLTA